MLRFNLTAALIITGALVVIYVRLKDSSDTNIPVLFFAGLLAYGALAGDMIPPWLTYMGLGVAALLRFEFLNAPFTRFFKAEEICILAGVLYACATWILWL